MSSSTPEVALLVKFCSGSSSGGGGAFQVMRFPANTSFGNASTMIALKFGLPLSRVINIIFHNNHEGILEGEYNNNTEKGKEGRSKRGGFETLVDDDVSWRYITELASTRGGSNALIFGQVVPFGDDGGVRRKEQDAWAAAAMAAAKKASLPAPASSSSRSPPIEPSWRRRRAMDRYHPYSLPATPTMIRRDEKAFRKAQMSSRRVLQLSTRISGHEEWLEHDFQGIRVSFRSTDLQRYGQNTLPPATDHDTTARHSGVIVIHHRLRPVPQGVKGISCDPAGEVSLTLGTEGMDIYWRRYVGGSSSSGVVDEDTFSGMNIEFCMKPVPRKAIKTTTTEERKNPLLMLLNRIEDGSLGASPSRNLLENADGLSVGSPTWHTFKTLKDAVGLTGSNKKVWTRIKVPENNGLVGFLEKEGAREDR